MIVKREQFVNLKNLTRLVCFKLSHMQFQYSLDALQFAIPAICSGVLVAGFSLFIYIYHRSKESVHLAMVFMGFFAFVFVGSETLILSYGGWLHLRQIALQFHRLEHLGGAFFVFGVFYLISFIMDENKKWAKINRTISYIGLGFSVVLLIIAYVVPDLFISMEQPHKDWLQTEMAYGRGKEGILYIFRDAILSFMMIYSIIFTAWYVKKYKNYRYLFPWMIGLLLAFFGGIEDTIDVYTKTFLLLPNIRFSRFSLGVTFFVFFTMAGLIRKMIDQSKQVEKSYHTIQESEAKIRNLFDLSDDLIFTLDITFDFVLVNPTIQKYLRYSPEELKGKNFIEMIYKSDKFDSFSKIFVMEKLENLIATGETITFSTNMKQKYVQEPKEFFFKFQLIETENKKEIIAQGTVLEQSVIYKFVEKEKITFKINNLLWNAELMSQRLVSQLNKFLLEAEINIIKTSLREILINAIEHGNLGITFEEKTNVMMTDSYFELLNSRQKDEKNINKKVIIDYLIDNERVIYRITDEGDGFDTSKILNLDMAEINEEGLAHGRGIMMTKNVFDEVKYNKKGNQVLLVKNLKKNSE